MKKLLLFLFAILTLCSASFLEKLHHGFDNMKKDNFEEFRTLFADNAEIEVHFPGNTFKGNPKAFEAYLNSIVKHYTTHFDLVYDLGQNKLFSFVDFVTTHDDCVCSYSGHCSIQMNESGDKIVRHLVYSNGSPSMASCMQKLLAKEL